MHRNSEGYADPTAGAAMQRILYQQYIERQKKRNAYKNRKKIYVASRYAGSIEANVQAAIRYCRRVIEAGYMPIASHLLYPQMLDDSDFEEREMGLMFGLVLLRMCDEVWVFGEISRGMAEEIKEAKDRKKTLRYFKEETT